MPSSTEFSQPRSPTLQKDSLLSEPPGKPKNTGVGTSRYLPNPGIEPGSPALQVDPLPAEPPGKPSNHWTSREFPGITLLFVYLFIFGCSGPSLLREHLSSCGDQGLLSN